MSKIKNGGLDQYGAEPFEQQQFGTAGIEGVNFGADRIQDGWPTTSLVSLLLAFSHRKYI